MSVRENIGELMMALAGISASGLVLVIYVWTIGIAYSALGLFAAVMAATVPIALKFIGFSRWVAVQDLVQHIVFQ